MSEQALGICNTCGRKTWSREHHCERRWPDGAPCGGTFYVHPEQLEELVSAAQRVLDSRDSEEIPFTATQEQDALDELERALAVLDHGKQGGAEDG